MTPSIDPRDPQYQRYLRAVAGAQRVLQERQVVENVSEDVTLWMCFLGEGQAYLKGVTDNSAGAQQSYWFPAGADDDYIVYQANFSAQDAQRLLAFQDGAPTGFADGYQAADFVVARQNGEQVVARGYGNVGETPEQLGEHMQESQTGFRSEAPEEAPEGSVDIRVLTYDTWGNEEDGFDVNSWRTIAQPRLEIGSRRVEIADIEQIVRNYWNAKSTYPVNESETATAPITVTDEYGNGDQYTVFCGPMPIGSIEVKQASATGLSESTQPRWNEALAPQAEAREVAHYKNWETGEVKSTAELQDYLGSLKYEEGKQEAPKWEFFRNAPIGKRGDKKPMAEARQVMEIRMLAGGKFGIFDKSMRGAKPVAKANSWAEARLKISGMLRDQQKPFKENRSLTEASPVDTFYGHLDELVDELERRFHNQPVEFEIKEVFHGSNGLPAATLVVDVSGNQYYQSLRLEILIQAKPKGPAWIAGGDYAVTPLYNKLFPAWDKKFATGGAADDAIESATKKALRFHANRAVDFPTRGRGPWQFGMP